MKLVKASQSIDKGSIGIVESVGDEGCIVKFDGIDAPVTIAVGCMAAITSADAKKRKSAPPDADDAKKRKLAPPAEAAMPEGIPYCLTTVDQDALIINNTAMAVLYKIAVSCGPGPSDIRLSTCGTYRGLSASKTVKQNITLPRFVFQVSVSFLFCLSLFRLMS